MTDVGGFQDAVQLRVIQLADQENLGITIQQCNVKSIPPRQLQDIFNQVTEAVQNRTRLLDEAHSYENLATNSADAQASAIINEAQSASVLYVQNLQADAKAFSSLLPNYGVNPDLFAADGTGADDGRSVDERELPGLFADDGRWRTDGIEVNVESRTAGAEERRGGSVK